MSSYLGSCALQSSVADSGYSYDVRADSPEIDPLGKSNHHRHLSSKSSKSGKSSSSKTSKSSKSSKGSKASRDGSGGGGTVGYDYDDDGYGQRPSPSRSLRAGLDTRYPGYDGDIRPSGTVTVTFPRMDSLKFSFDLRGLETGCVDCGVHIHAGTTCDYADGVLGHYYSTDVDPWTTDEGAVYDADSDGNANGSFVLTSGYDTYSENVGHSVVIHGQDGTRLSCGILKPKGLR